LEGGEMKAEPGRNASSVVRIDGIGVKRRVGRWRHRGWPQHKRLRARESNSVERKRF
jgi:hypothetical protein